MRNKTAIIQNNKEQITGKNQSWKKPPRGIIYGRI